MNSAITTRHLGKTQSFWTQHREASLNWLALGLLLAAWNVSDDPDPKVTGRPERLRGYCCVSVRAAQKIVGPGHKNVNVL